MNKSLQNARYWSLATFRRNGDSVATPVWFAGHGDAFYVFSAQDSGKVKRLRNSSRAQVAACDVRGKLRGEWQDAEAFLSDRSEECAAAYQALRRKYGLQMHLLDFFSRLSGKIDQRQIIRITLSGKKKKN